jgi:hypothetical protein
VILVRRMLRGHPWAAVEQGVEREATDPPAPFGDSRRDGFSVNIQTEISRTIVHDRLLRCGSASWFSYQARA